MEIPPGALAALVGPNGAGKSTLLRTWLGFERPTKGSVSIDGRNPSQAASASSSVSYVPQLSPTWPGLSVREHVEYAAVLRPGLDTDGAVARMRGLGLPLERRASTLSGGERAQVVLSLALAARTRVLLLDEPLASLDPLARREFLRVLQTAARENHQTVVLSSHILGDIEAICDWIVLLRAGRVVLQGSIAAVLEAHRIADGPGSGDVVARYLDLDGSLKTLVRSTSGRKPTLEEVVIAYLAGPPGSPRLA